MRLNQIYPTLNAMFRNGTYIEFTSANQKLLSHQLLNMGILNQVLVYSWD
jgi:hypothetical protein